MTRPAVLLAALAMAAIAHEGHGKKHAPDSAKALKNPLTAAPANAESGRAAYDRLCATCHDADGRALSSAAKQRKPRPTNLADHRMDSMQDGEIFWVITKGIAKSMPAFQIQLSETERWQVVLYVRQLGKSSHKGHH